MTLRVSVVGDSDHAYTWVENKVFWKKNFFHEREKESERRGKEIKTRFSKEPILVYLYYDLPWGLFNGWGTDVDPTWSNLELPLDLTYGNLFMVFFQHLRLLLYIRERLRFCRR